jgi:phosphotriesterase-related protein
MTVLHTTLGPIDPAAFHADTPDALFLPHEHVFVDLRTPDAPGHGQAEAADVIALMAPEIERAKQAGVRALTECTPLGVGRRVDLVKAVSLATQLPIVVATGVYREPWVPRWVADASEDALCRWMRGELEGEIESTGVRAAWIKLSAGDDGVTPIERKILRAAVRAALETGAVIGSHTIRARVVMDQLDEVEALGFSAGSWIAIHANAEPNFAQTLALARRGAWIELDWIGKDDDAVVIERVRRLLDAGHGDKILLSHDRGWFDPAHPRGAAPGFPKSFTYISDVFLPKLRAAGIDARTERLLMWENPLRAYAR